MLSEMPTFSSFDGTQIAYEEVGSGPAVVLVHGFASESFINWIRPGTFDALEGAGYRAIAVDLRGHGSSGAPHDPSAYEGDTLERDVRGLLDHLALDRCHLVGYSMGAWTVLAVARGEPRVASLVLGGIGGSMLRSQAAERGESAERGSPLADAMLAEDKRSIESPMARSFRDFADLTGADRHALAALQRAARARPGGFEDVRVPALVLCGDNDPLAGSPEELARRLPDGRTEVVGGSHLNVINNPAFRDAILTFLASVEGR